MEELSWAPRPQKNSPCAFLSGLLINEGEGPGRLRGSLSLARSPSGSLSGGSFLTLPSLSSFGPQGKETFPPTFTRRPERWKERKVEWKMQERVCVY